MFSLVDIEPEIIIRSDHGSVHDIHEIAGKLKHRSACSSCSASIVYLFDWCSGDLRHQNICLYSLWGVLICDHDIVEEDALDELADEYLNFWQAEKWLGYEDREGIHMCSFVQEIYSGYCGNSRDMANALKMFADMIEEDPDYLKFKPYIREVFERTVHSLRLVSEAGDPHEGTQMHYIDNKIELTDFTIEL